MIRVARPRQRIAKLAAAPGIDGLPKLLSQLLALVLQELPDCLHAYQREAAPLSRCT